MYISALKIDKYRNFSGFEILLKPFTLLIGENNCGKTNLLNALGLILSQEITFFKKRVLEIEDINIDAVLKFKEQVVNESIGFESVEFPEVKVEVIMEGFTDDQAAVVGDWFIDQNLSKAQLTYLYKVRGNFNVKKWIEGVRAGLQKLQKEQGEAEESFRRRKIDFVDFPIDVYEYTIFGGNDPVRRAEPFLLKMLRMEFLEALRDATRELMASKDYRLLYRILNNRDENCFDDLKDTLLKLEYHMERNNELKKIKKEITDYLDKISLHEQNKDNVIDFHFTSPETSEILRKISIVYGEKPINIERNGLGRNNLLYISLVLSHLMKSSLESSSVFKLIGIEEPEAHLHPHLQDHLARNIKEDIGKDGNLQIILTSHSANIAAKLDLENTSVLYRDESDSIKSHYILKGFSVGKEMPSKRYLMKYLDSTNSTMFFSRKVILVEGISEELLVPIFFKIYRGYVLKHDISKLFELGDASWMSFFENLDDKRACFKKTFCEDVHTSGLNDDLKKKLLNFWIIRRKNMTLEKIRCNVVNVRGVAFDHFLKVIEKGYFIKCLVLTDSDADTRQKNRVADLKAAYASVSTIKIQQTDSSTFEKDVLESNKNGKGKDILIHSLLKTRFKKGYQVIKGRENEDINIEDFFGAIEEYKSEFAFNLSERIKQESTGFVVPPYITAGFDFLVDNNE